MIDGARVTDGEHGLVRVFLASYQLDMEIGHNGTYDMVCEALGIEKIGHSDVQQVRKTALDGVSLSQFLMDAYDIEPLEIAPIAKELDALDGLVLVIRSSAFLDRPVTLKPNDHAKLIATLREPDTSASVTLPLMSKNAEGVLTSPPAKKTPSDAAMGGRVATIALLVMGLLVWLMIKVAG